ncbi:MAG: hypothetical protein FWD23_08175 [Oscillospiraceae bacterium]|nr:hypothetical protein [Oscillospiraceae bacterium]
MKPVKRISAIILTAIMIASLLSAASISQVSAASGDKPNPAGDYLKFTVDIKKSDPGLAYNFVTFKTINYMMEEGDKVEYDVWISMEENGWGFVDSQGIDDVTGNNFRDSGGADDNGVGIHPGQDISEYAFGQWYHRVIEIPDAFWGKEMPVFQVSTHATSDELEYTGYALYDNIVITDAKGAIKLVIFRDAADWDGKTSLGPVKDSSSTLECLTFTDEDMAGFAAAEVAKAAEEASKEASKAEADASREASREAASIEASVKQSEEEAAAAAAAAEEEGNGAAAENAPKSDEEEGSNLILIICIAGGGVLLIVVIILIAVGGKKKKAPKE